MLSWASQQSGIGLGALRRGWTVAIWTFVAVMLATAVSLLVATITFPWLAGGSVGQVGTAITATAIVVAGPAGFILVRAIDRLNEQRLQLASREALLDRAQQFAGLGYWELCPAGGHMRLSSEAHVLIGDPGRRLRLTIQDLRDMTSPADQAALNRAIKRMLESDAREQVDIDITGSDGQAKALRLTGSRVAATDGTSIKPFGALQDISERRSMEAELRACEDHYRHAVDLNPQIPWMQDADGNSLEISPRWLELTGLTVEESRGSNWIHILHPDDHDRIMQVWQDALSLGHPYDVEYRLRLADGAYRWFRARASARRDDNGKLLCWYGTLEDIHDRKASEIALRASEAFASSILNASTDCVEVVGSNNRFSYINPPVLDLLEIKDFEVLRGCDWIDLWPDEAGSSIREAVTRAAAGTAVRFTSLRPCCFGSLAGRWS